MLANRNATCSGSSCCHQYGKDGYEPQHVPPLSVGLPHSLRGLCQKVLPVCARGCSWPTQLSGFKHHVHVSTQWQTNVTSITAYSMICSMLGGGCLSSEAVGR
ncbi:unnamed protein product, partial [Ectocarpus sp. 12 AP-2014]